MKNPLPALALLALAGCGGAQTTSTGPATPAEALPTLGGEIVYPTPISQAGADLQTFWRAAQDQLQDRMPAIPSDLPEENFGRAVGETVRPWIQRRIEGLRTLAEQVRPLMAQGHAPEVGVLVGATFGFVVDDVLAQMDAVPSPERVRNDPEMEARFRQLLRDSTVNIAELGQHAYEACSHERDGAPESVRAWVSRCDARVTALGERVAASRASREARERDSEREEEQASAVPPECEGGEYTSHVRDWDGPPPDEHAPREVALVLKSDAVTGADQERVLTAVAARLRRVRGVRLIPRTEVRAAEQLVEQRRIAPGGPVCGRAWPVTALLARRHHNLVLATAEGFCSREVNEGEAPDHASGPEHCSLAVTFHRVGTDDDSNVPDYLSADVTDPHAGAAGWVHAAGALAPPSAGGTGGILGALSGGGMEHVEYRVLGYADDEPALRIGDVMYDWLGESHVREHMAACSPGRGVGSYTIRWTVSPTGEVTAASAEPITRLSEGDSDAVAQCIAEQLRHLAWPCTPSGQPVNVEARMCVGR